MKSNAANGNGNAGVPKGQRDTRVSLAPLSVGEAIKGLFAIPAPEETKPSRRKKAPAAPKG